LTQNSLELSKATILGRIFVLALKLTLPYVILSGSLSMKLCVLLGGPSAEREVSLLSGSAMARALSENGHEVTLLDPAFNKPMKLEDFKSEAAHENPPTPEELNALSRRSTVLESLMSDTVRNSDAVVFGLHGVPGEDGMMQAVLEFLEKPYTGSDSRTSAVCIDKEITKILLVDKGIPVPKGVSAIADTSEADLIVLYEEAKALFGERMVIKPNDQGSTVGLTILKEDDSAKFIEGVKLSWQYSKKALIEEFIDGRELTVTVLEGEPLPIVEIITQGGFYDYHRKYTPGMTTYVCPAELNADLTRRIQADALNVFKTCGARGYARVDYRLDPEGNFYCLEINTLPGMTATSLVPKAAKAAGMSFNELCEKILRSAFA
jgi:D-alanine-D-alanine ligase